jgi:hypothetical protein
MQPHWLAVPEQFAPAQIKPEPAEADLLAIHRIRQKSHGTVIF